MSTITKTCDKPNYNIKHSYEKMEQMIKCTQDLTTTNVVLCAQRSTLVIYKYFFIVLFSVFILLE